MEPKVKGDFLDPGSLGADEARASFGVKTPAKGPRQVHGHDRARSHVRLAEPR